MSDQTLSKGASSLANRFSMAGKRALVTGGSVSIGREIVLAFAEAGADVAIHYSKAADAAFDKPVAATELLDEVTAMGVIGGLIEADFGVPTQASKCVKQACDLLGGLDVLVVCASIQYRREFLDLTVDEINHQIQVNFCATIELLQAALPVMREAGWGRILTVGSFNQTRPSSDLSVYAALKSAQHNLSINLAKQFAIHGITINNLSPGLIATERNRWRRQDPDVWRQIQETSGPMRRAGDPREMAGAALLLCSDAGSFITGADLEATGGRHL